MFTNCPTGQLFVERFLNLRRQLLPAGLIPLLCGRGYYNQYGRKLFSCCFFFSMYSMSIHAKDAMFAFFPILISLKEIIHKLKQGTTPPFRPVVTRDQMPEEVMDLMNKCWSEEPSARPDFSHIRTAVRKLNK